MDSKATPAVLMNVPVFTGQIAYRAARVESGRPIPADYVAMHRGMEIQGTTMREAAMRLMDKIAFVRPGDFRIDLTAIDRDGVRFNARVTRVGAGEDEVIVYERQKVI